MTSSFSFPLYVCLFKSTESQVSILGWLLLYSLYPFFLVSSSTLTVSICWDSEIKTSSPILSKHPTYLFYWTLLTGSHTSLKQCIQDWTHLPPETLTDSHIISKLPQLKPRGIQEFPRSLHLVTQSHLFHFPYTSKSISHFLTAGPGLCHPLTELQSVPCRLQPPWLPSIRMANFSVYLETVSVLTLESLAQEISQSPLLVANKTKSLFLTENEITHITRIHRPTFRYSWIQELCFKDSPLPLCFF